MNLPARSDNQLSYDQPRLDKSGMTLVELLLSISILMLLSAITLPMGLRFLTSANHSTTVDQIVSFLRTAQTNAQTQKDSGIWGVCLVGGNIIRLFADSCNSPTFQLNYPLPNSTSVSNLSTITFNNLRGEPSQTATVLINSNQYSSSININAAGGILVD